MKSKFVIETGNSSWWKNIKYRRKAAETIRNYRQLGYQLKKTKTYRLSGANTLIYSDYELR
jgi:hypothetical protein